MSKRAIAGVSLGGLLAGAGAFHAAHWNNGPSSQSPKGGPNLIALNAMGLLGGKVASIPLPHPIRHAVLSRYCQWTGSDASEATLPLDRYTSISSFFAREVKSDLRPCDPEAALVSPADGKVVSCGTVGAYGSITIKGIRYPVREILAAKQREPMVMSQVAGGKRAERGRRRGYIVMGMGRGDCHRFASPTEWKVHVRRHVPGYLLWLNPVVEGLYTENERVALLGEWEFGLFTCTAVAAAGKGCISLDCEESLLQNALLTKLGKVSTENYAAALELSRGASVGAFQLGSAIVLVFEAPGEGFAFDVQEGDCVRSGQRIASTQQGIRSALAKLDKAQRVYENNDKVYISRSSSRGRARRTW